MHEHIEKLLAQYRRKGILIDTNVLLLYFVGSYDPNWISKFKRTIIFAPEDYELQVWLIHHFETIVTTPNVLTEVNSLSNQLPEQIKNAYYKVFGQLTSNLEEAYLPSEEVCDLPHFQRFGLTDSGIIDLAPEKHLVLTDDLKLYGYLSGKGVDVINFNHIRPMNWR